MEAVALNTKPRALRQQFLLLARERELREERRRQSDLGEQGRLGGLIHFVRYLWPILEPNRPLIEGRALEAIILHLEAVTRGEIKRLLINVPPGFMKSMLVNVFWPAWEWSACGLSSTRYVTFSYAAHLTERDNGKFRDLLRSHKFKELWPGAFALTEDGKIRVANDKTGWKFASSFKGVGTGERGDRVILDDPHNIKEGESEAVRVETVRWVREAMSNRLNSMDDGVIVVVMQRVHEEDVSGALIEDDLGYVHLMIPMYHDPGRHCSTAIGWADWRTEDGELAWPDRFSLETCKALERTMGPYAWTGQYQQSPEPRGGNIFKRDWWKMYHLDAKGKPLQPPHYMVASVDPAFTAKSENDPSALTVWGLFKDTDGHTKLALIWAWEKRLDLHGVEVQREKDEKDADYLSRAKQQWGLVEWIQHDCKRLQVDLLLVENKASGLDVYSEIRRLNRGAKWGVQLVDPGNLDKRSRAYSVQHLFADGSIFAPDRDWAERTIGQFAKFRGLSGDEDHLVDSGTQAIRHLRDTGHLLRIEEKLEEDRAALEYKSPLPPLYGDP